MIGKTIESGSKTAPVEITDKIAISTQIHRAWNIAYIDRRTIPSFHMTLKKGQLFRAKPALKLARVDITSFENLHDQTALKKVPVSI